MAGIVGFNSNDPLGNDGVGYRAQQEPNPFVNGNAEVTYNGFQFPPCISARGTIVPEYDKTGRTVKYHTIALTIECIITQYDLSEPSNSNPTIDRHMDSIRRRLGESGQPLTFYLQGFGSIIVNQPAGVYDVDNGPKPQVLDWEPLGGGLAARIQWLVTTRIAPCALVKGLDGIIELNYDITWSIGDAGLLVRTVTGYLEVARTRTPNPGSTSAGTLVNSPNWDIYMQSIRTSFPALPGYTRNENFKETANRKSLNFTLTDTEIASPQAYPTKTLEIDMKESLSSTLENGFQVWDWNLSGSVTVPMGRTANSNPVVNKRAAWQAIGIILRDRRDRAQGAMYSNQIPDSTGEERHEVTWIPQKIRFDNDIFGMGISVDISYMVLCSSSLILQASGMFDYIQAAPNMTWSNWRKFLEQNGIRSPGIRPTPSQEIIVDLCHSLQGSAAPSLPQENAKSPGERDIIDANAPTKEKSWVSYENNFLFLKDNFTVAGVVLSPEAKEKQESAPPRPKDEIETVISSADGSPGSSQWMKPNLQTSAEEICYVVMEGSATRIGYKINPPVLVSVGGAKAIECGGVPNGDKLEYKPYTDIKSKPVGLRSPTGGPTNIYRVKWRKVYIIQGQPADWKPQTTGHPQLYR